MGDVLISKTAAIDALKRAAYWQDAERKITELPAVDAAPVVHARWIDIPDKPYWDQKMCSVCGDYFCCQNNYCPNCGAKMDEEAR